MKKQTKRLIALALCLVMLFSVSAQAAAYDERQDLGLLYWDNEDLQCTVLILDYYYGSGFTEIGDVPQVRLTNGDETQTIDANKIILERHKTQSTAEEMQLYICLPAYLRDGEADAIPTSTVLSVSEGAFRTAEGEPSPAVSVPLKIRNAYTYGWERIEHVAGGIAYLPRTIYRAKRGGGAELPKEIKIAADTEVTLCSRDRAWNSAEITFTENEQPLEPIFPAQKLGKHTIRGRVNDFVYEDFSYTVITNAEAKLTNLVKLGLESLRGIYLVPGGLALQILPPYGTIAGGIMLLSWWNSASSFFIQLFSHDLMPTVGVTF
ncbi:MAG: hypothetical protein K6F09_07840 [Clostridiales bacterium]|nr:hypothetical protein [Clostridiales bacterium]